MNPVRYTSAQRGKLKGYRSGLETAVASQLEREGIPAEYEEYPVYYKPQRTTARYTPDFVLPNGIVIETKGMFVSADRTKHKDVKASHPDLDVRFVFSNPQAKLSKASKTTYSMWCQHYGFLHATKLIPLAWLQEPPEPKRIAALKAAGRKPIE